MIVEQTLRWHNSNKAKLFSPPKNARENESRVVGFEKYHYFSCINVIYKLPLQYESQRSRNI